ncbi:MAG: isopentenyl-diphosphate delta-isomerase [Fluviicola sp.]|nr:MAG: isopentenyl-diphosphate delta-isomerase [Fluviicola sp.]
MMEEVVLVDENDKVLGTMEKIQAHQEGLLHRAFSVLIFNDKNEMLIHKRATDKYHCGGLWTNACCSHPRLNEATIDAAKRRLTEEMGFTCELKYINSFIYKVSLNNDLTEHEFDHLYVGKYNGLVEANPKEVEDWKFVSLDQIKKDIEKQPDLYTFWFKSIISEHLDKIDFKW